MTNDTNEPDDGVFAVSPSDNIERVIQDWIKVKNNKESTKDRSDYSNVIPIKEGKQ